MVSYQKIIVKHSMEVFDNATKSCEKFRCFDENRAWPFLLRGMIWNALRCALRINSGRNIFISG